ncbi:baculoviral IAP repeat-containing protein 7-B-like isoform X2 [Camponotus floridanus]|uniref:baculoviral IAP repeat-containing protein 7-B-like isoform X2 n=1 Tax=Camponotus floridanus TaxID=104421 RepID=UPI000DC6CA7C|nr:baculoviral IAP repeat-containing protein 7-B-like isoform X2 [Camponotus floridanus]
MAEWSQCSRKSHTFFSKMQICSKIAKHPNYRFYQTRFNSFISWPLVKIQTGQQLAEAGFFYTGQKDKVVCFYCGLILKEWTDYEDPWEAHYKWAATCFYILTIKGEDYLDSLHKDAYERERRMVHISKKGKNLAHYVSPEKCAEALENIRIYEKDPQSLRNNIEDVTNNISPSKDENKEIKKKTVNKLLCDINAKTSDSKDDILCIICFEKQRNILLKPCGHILTCADCYKTTLNVENYKCSFCGEKVKGSIKIRII